MDHGLWGRWDKRMEHHMRDNFTVHIFSSIISLKLWQPPSQDGECIFQKKHCFPKKQIYSNDNKKGNNWGKPFVILLDYQALKFFH